MTKKESTTGHTDKRTKHVEVQSNGFSIRVKNVSEKCEKARFSGLVGWITTVLESLTLNSRHTIKTITYV